jgi:hypothetical protein
MIEQIENIESIANTFSLIAELSYSKIEDDCNLIEIINTSIDTFKFANEKYENIEFENICYW